MYAMEHPFSQGRTLLVVNPTAQNGNCAAVASHVEAALRAQLGDNLDVRATTAAGEATAIAQSACGAYASLVVLGGDGTLHEVANGVMKEPFDVRPTIGLIPLGSGNDYARTLNMPLTLDHALTRIFETREQLFDIGVCNGEYFVETLSFGLDAAVALGTIELRERTGKSGNMLYVQSGLDQLLHHLDTYHTEAYIDGNTPFRRPILMMAVQIGKTYGGGFKVCPNAEPDDGYFDLCYADAPMSVAKATALFMLARNARHVGSKQVHFDRAKKLNITFNERPPVQMDGEAHTADFFDIEILHHKFKVLKA